MALKINKNQETIKVITRMDDALPEDLSEENWSLYIDTLDESVLGLKGEPTRFVLRVHLPLAAQKAILNEQATVSSTGQVQINIGFMLEEVRAALVGIENPVNTNDPIDFKLENDGLASKELIAMLQTAGVVAFLMGIRQNYIAKKGQKPIKK